MNALSQFHFIRPVWLIGLPLVILLWWRIRRQNDPLLGWRRMIDPRLLQALTVGGDSAVDRYRGGRLLVGWSAALLALAGPTWRVQPSPWSDDAAPVMMVIRTGETMNRDDLAPSRMERARLKAIDYAEARSGQPLGLIAYAGSAHLVLPPTKDTSVVAAMAAELDPTIMPKQGDDLSAALRLAAETLDDQSGIVLIVLDDVSGDAIAELAEFRQKYRLPILLHAVTLSPSPELDAIRSAAVELSADVTEMTADRSDTESLTKKIARSGQWIATEGDETRWVESGWWFLPVAALASLIGFRREVDGLEEVSR